MAKKKSERDDAVVNKTQLVREFLDTAAADAEGGFGEKSR